MKLFRSILFLYIYGFQGFLCSVNLALKKPAILSSDFIIPNTGNIFYTADRAVDENTSNVFGTPEIPAGTCCHANSQRTEQVVYWEVDLGQQSIVTSVLISYRLGRSDRMNGYVLKFSNVSLGAGNVCYQDTFPGNPALTERHYCTLTGRYFRYENNVGFAELCNFEAYGCPINFYGPSCSLQCLSNCLNPPCNPDDGSCIGGCKPGWQGPMCQQGCLDGTFGSGCTQQCFCRLSPCNKETGLCPPGGCQAGWDGPNCDKTCSTGRFGLACSSICNCAGSPECNPINGTCISGQCQPGYISDSCSQRCPSGTFGQGCNSTCGNCAAGRVCNHVTGFCDNGCADGWHGLYCNISCNDGTYGFNCSQNCGNCFNSSNCDFRNGDCPNFRCDSGFFGRDCKALTRGGESVGGSSTTTTVVLVLLFLVIGVGIVVFVLKRKKVIKRKILRKTASLRYSRPFIELKYDEENKHASSDNRGERKSPKQTIIKDEEFNFKDDDVLYSNQPDAETYSITSFRIDEFSDVIERKKDGEFAKEYNQLPVGAMFPQEAGADPRNKSKNRFLATFPYDKNRVILPKIKGVEYSDYINASYIDGVERQKVYIATQGPKKSTISDFWRMVWKEKVFKIVMVTNLVEGAKVKCEKYWPDLEDQMLTGHLILDNIKETKYAAFVIRELKMSSKKSDKERLVYHYHFTRWPDHGTPDASQLIHFDSRLDMHKTPESSPLLVHCSAGIGRTGTFIGLHELTKQERKMESIDVCKYAKIMRDGRMNMIQTIEQYVFLHEALLEAIDYPKTVYLREEFPQMKMNLLNKDKPENQTLLRNQFECLQSLKPAHDLSLYSDALQEDNKEKNRNMEVISQDKYRTFLTSHPAGNNGYINAVTVPSYHSLTGFISTQIPLPNTIDDFWAMVYDQECRTIVILDKIPEDVKMIPPVNEFMHAASFVVYTERTFQRTNTVTDVDIVISPKEKENGGDRNVKILMTNVDELDVVPENSEVFACLCESYMEDPDYRQYIDSPTIVVCRDSAARCGMFITMATTVQRILTDKDLDVFGAVKIIQERQPRFVDSYEQYKCIHDLVDDYMDSNQLYVNV